ncbi:unnamed protein product [Hermetia illucens]|uniref:carnosine N-methyltransferase n=1 Tax=Hermetia illucens TaxID=343691 RepID=A0A7R8UUG5_HERIL|nr:carnosine N-methyltransferase isoform X2 [Hermetia illucens]CAD7087266.1 unnamed protein product [Hermetia illucens]
MMNPDDHAEEERKSFLQVLAAFKHYDTYSMLRVNKTESYLNTLPNEHQDMLLPYRNHLNKLRDCIECNYRIISKMIKDSDQLFLNSGETSIRQEIVGADEVTKIRQQDLESVQITLKQFARDWSSDGEEERRQCYQPIIDAIMDFYKPEEYDLSKIKILVPGAGLGRMAYELAYRGYCCEGNEFSFFMLIASNFVLNKCEIENQYTIYPWIHQYVNNVCRSDQIAPITFPDVSPVEAPPKGPLSMVAGDFLLVYTEPDSWDGIATCFFIDCANNVIEFIETIYRILKPGAIWVNLGPLLYHYSDVQDELSIEPTCEDLVAIIKAVGFELLKCETGVRTQYAQNPRSMQQSEYLSIFCVCRKPLVINNGIHIEEDN